MRSSTTGFPQEFGCLEVGPRVSAAYPAKGQPEEPFHDWSTVATVPTGRVQVSAMPISSAGQELGFVTLVQDLSYIDRREARARTFLIIISGILAVTAFGVPLIVAKRARHDWGLELRTLLRGGGKQSREFQPILSDVRELIDRMSRGTGRRSGQWTPREAEVDLEQAFTR